MYSFIDGVATVIDPAQQPRPPPEPEPEPEPGTPTGEETEEEQEARGRRRAAFGEAAALGLHEAHLECVTPHRHEALPLSLFEGSLKGAHAVWAAPGVVPFLHTPAWPDLHVHILGLATK
jgi:hypothetical protein